MEALNESHWLRHLELIYNYFFAIICRCWHVFFHDVVLNGDELNLLEKRHACLSCPCNPSSREGLLDFLNNFSPQTDAKPTFFRVSVYNSFTNLLTFLSFWNCPFCSFLSIIVLGRNSLNWCLLMVVISCARSRVNMCLEKASQVINLEYWYRELLLPYPPKTPSTILSLVFASWSCCCLKS